MTPYESADFFERNPEDFDPVQTFLESVPRMVRMARRSARNEAISYRGVHVGASMMFFDPDTYAEAILSGSNVKAKPEDEKYCAEMDIIDQARVLGHKKATGLVIAGPSKSADIESIHGIATPTLHPCSECRDKMTENKDIVDEDTLIITTSTTENIYQVHSFQEIKLLYDIAEDENLSLGIESASPLEFDNWSEQVDLYKRLKESPTANGVSNKYLARLALGSSIDLGSSSDE